MHLNPVAWPLSFLQGQPITTFLVKNTPFSTSRTPRDHGFMSRPLCHDYQSEWIMGSRVDRAFVSQGGELPVKALCRGEWLRLGPPVRGFQPPQWCWEGERERDSYAGGEQARNHYREWSLSATEVPANALREASIMYWALSVKKKDERQKKKKKV